MSIVQVFCPTRWWSSIGSIIMGIQGEGAIVLGRRASLQMIYASTKGFILWGLRSMYGGLSSVHQSLTRVIAFGVQLFFKFTDGTAKCHLCENWLSNSPQINHGLLVISKILRLFLDLKFEQLPTDLSQFWLPLEFRRFWVKTFVMVSAKQKRSWHSRNRTQLPAWAWFSKPISCRPPALAHLCFIDPTAR